MIGCYAWCKKRMGNSFDLKVYSVHRLVIRFVSIGWQNIHDVYGEATSVVEDVH